MATTQVATRCQHCRGALDPFVYGDRLLCDRCERDADGDDEHRERALAGHVTWHQWSYVPQWFELHHPSGHVVNLREIHGHHSALVAIEAAATDDCHSYADIGALVTAIQDLRGNAGWPLLRILPERELAFDLDPMPIPTLRSGVYAIRSGNAVKIGCASDIAKRLGQLQTGNQDELQLLGVLSDNSDDEGRWHERFRHLRIRGEWFCLGEQIAVFIRAARHVDARRQRMAILRANAVSARVAP